MAAPVVGVYTCHGKCVDSDPAASAFAADQQFPDRLPTAYLEIAETHRTRAAHLDDVSHNPFTYACETERKMAEINQHRHDPPKQEVDALFLPSSGPAGPSMPALIKSLLAAGAALGPLTAVRLVRAVRYLQAHPELTDAEAAGHAALDAADKAALSLLGELTGAPVVRGADGKVVVGSGAAGSGAGEPKSTDAAAGQPAQPARIGLAAGEGVYETTFDNHSNSVSNSIDVNASSQSLQQPLATGEPSSGSAADSDGPAAADSPPAGIDRKPIPSSTAAGVAPRAHAPGAPVDIPCMCPLIPPTLVPEGLHWLAFASAAYKTTRQSVLDVLNGWGQGGSVSGAIPDALLPAGSSAGVSAVADAAHAAPVTGDPSHINSSGIVGIDAAADNITPAPAAGGSKVNRLRRPHPHFRDSDLLFARLQPAPLVQAHILVRDRRKRALVLAIRGTATWSDVLADLAAAPLPFSGGSAHTGMAAVVDGLLHYKVDDDGSGGVGGGNDQKHLRAAGAVAGNVLGSSVAQGGTGSAGTRGAVGVGGSLHPVAEEAGNVSNGAPASPRAAAMATPAPHTSSSTTAPSGSAQPAASSSSGGVDQTYSCPLARAFAEARIAASRRVRTATIASASRSMEGGEDREGTGQLAAAASPAATALPQFGLGDAAAATRDSAGTTLHQARPAAALPSRTPSTYTETEASAPEDVELQRDSAFCSRIPDLETKGFGGIAVILQRAIRAHPGYRVIVTGHSLGAGVAALLTLKLVRIVQFLRQESDRRLNTAVRSTTGGNHAGGAADGEHSGEAPGQAPGEATGTSSTASSTPSWSDDTLLPELPAPQIMPRPVHCWAFAVPACMSPELAAWTTLSAADTGAAVAGSIPPSLRDAPWAKQIEEQLRKGRRSGNGNSTRSSEWDRDQTLDPSPPASSSSSRSLSSSSASLPTGEATAEDDDDGGGDVGKASDSRTTASRSSSKRSSTSTTASWSELRRCPLITSIVLGDDVVPRLTLMSVKALASAVDSMPLSAALASLPLDIAATCVALPTCGVLTAVQAVMDAFVASVKALRPGGQARALGGAHSGAAAGGVVPGQGAAAAVQSQEAAKADAPANKEGVAGESHSDSEPSAGSSGGDAGAGGAANAEQSQLPLPASSTDLPDTNANNPFITIAAGEGVFVTMDAADTATTDVVQLMQRLEGHSIVMEPFAAAARGAAAESRGEIPVGAQPSIEEDGWTQFMCPKATMEVQSKCRQARSYFCKTGFVGKLRAAHIPEPVIIALLHMIEPGWAHPSQELVVPGRIYHLHLPPHRDPVPTAQAAADTATAASDGVGDTGYPAAGAPGAVAAGLESAAAASTGDGSAIGPGAATVGAALAPSLPTAASAGSLHRMVPAHLSSIRVSPTMGSDHHKVSYVTALKARLQCCEGNWVPF